MHNNCMPKVAIKEIEIGNLDVMLVREFATIAAELGNAFIPLAHCGLMVSDILCPAWVDNPVPGCHCAMLTAIKPLHEHLLEHVENVIFSTPDSSSR